MGRPGDNILTITNESINFGEWDSVVNTGSSTIVRSTDAAFPERGSVGLRATAVGASAAYVQKNLNFSVSPGTRLYLGWWQDFRQAQSAGAMWHQVLALNGSWYNGLLSRVNNLSQMSCRIYDDDDVLKDGSYIDVPDGWVYIVLEAFRSSAGGVADGYMRMYFDGSEVDSVSNIKLYSRLSACNYLQLGAINAPKDGAIIDYDEIKIATTYPEPFVMKKGVFGG